MSAATPILSALPVAANASLAGAAGAAFHPGDGADRRCHPAQFALLAPNLQLAAMQATLAAARCPARLPQQSGRLGRLAMGHKVSAERLASTASGGRLAGAAGHGRDCAGGRAGGRSCHRRPATHRRGVPSQQPEAQPRSLHCRCRCRRCRLTHLRPSPRPALVVQPVRAAGPRVVQVSALAVGDKVGRSSAPIQSAPAAPRTAHSLPGVPLRRPPSCSPPLPPPTFGTCSCPLTSSSTTLTRRATCRR